MELAELARNGQLVPSFAVISDWHRFATERIALVLCFGAFLGFAVKVPLVPFHTWPSLHVRGSADGRDYVAYRNDVEDGSVWPFFEYCSPIFFVQLRWVRTPLLWLAVATIVPLGLRCHRAEGFEAHLCLLFPSTTLATACLQSSLF